MSGQGRVERFENKNLETGRYKSVKNLYSCQYIFHNKRIDQSVSEEKLPEQIW